MVLGTLIFPGEYTATPIAESVSEYEKHIATTNAMIASFYTSHLDTV